MRKSFRAWAATLALVAIAIGQPNVAHDNIHLAMVQKLQSGSGRIARRDLVSPAAKNSGESLPRVIMIFDQEDRAEGTETRSHILIIGPSSENARVYSYNIIRIFLMAPGTM